MALAAVAVVVLVADEGEPRPAGVVNEARGSYRGVAIGADERRVRGVFGRAAEEGPFAPLGLSFGEAGVATPVAVWPPGRRERPRLLRYPSAAFLVGREGVFAFVVSEEGARTLRGVRVGDELSRAREAYELRCGRQPYGESLLGGTIDFPYCAGRVGRRFRIWFGRDPIRSITLMRVAK